MHTPENLESGKRYEIPHPTKSFEFISPLITLSADRRKVSFNWPTEKDVCTVSVQRFCIEANLAAALAAPRIDQLSLSS